MRLTFTRDFYIPKGARPVQDDQSDAIAYEHEYEVPTRDGQTATHYQVVIFIGKQNKPLANYYYRRAGLRDEAIQKAFANRREWLARKTADRAARKNFVHDVKVGDIYHTSWGYDQTNIEYFQVTEVKGKHAVLREIAQDRKETGWLQGTCVPVPGNFLKPRFEGDDAGLPIRRLIQNGYIKIDDVRHAWPHKPGPDGKFKPVGWTAYA